MAKNILFIMADQLRWDYLSCAGHPRLHTPHIDELAQRGVRFSQAYVQAPLCGPSRASFYTGRYATSHGAMINDDPLPTSEMLLGDYLQPLGYDAALIGKTHTTVSRRGLQRLGVSTESTDYARWRNGGFRPHAVHEGLYPDPIVPPTLAYNAYLREQGFPGENPWEQISNTALDVAGNPQSGWLLRNAGLASLVPEAHSETAWCTTVAMDYLREASRSGKPFCLHLSYIKPHWPLLASAPYHALYTAADVPEAVKSEAEKVDAHPVVAAFRAAEYSQSYADDAIREQVIPTYMGLIKQLDDHIGRLMTVLDEVCLRDNTLIVFTSDHGDYLGDHWLGEKDLFHDCSVRVPMIVVDPDSAADDTRGQVREELVEAIDLLPTLLTAVGAPIPGERLEGRALQPLLRDSSVPGDWRSVVISEIDYSDRGARTVLGQAPYDCRAWMIRDQAWKYIAYEGFRPQLFDLSNDPDELVDLGADPAYANIRECYQAQLFQWLRQRKIRTEMPIEKLDELGPALDEQYGIIIGRW